MELFKEDPYTSLLCFENYFSKYPEDNSARAYYISNLITVGEFEKADEEIIKLENILKRNCLYQHEIERANILNHNIKICKFKSYLYQGKYEQALDIYYSNIEELSYLGNEVKTFLEQKRGTLGKIVRGQNPYMIRQIYEYREDDFKDHIKKHLASLNDNDKKISSAIFTPEFPIEKVLEEVYKYIPSDKKMCYGFIENTYVFKYEQCGRSNNKLVDYFKVIVFSNTDNIITIYPANDCDNLPCVDLNYLKEKEEPKSLVKRPSQIDKFRQRYNLK